MAGLPKKYAKMGFKKGWAEYKKRNKSRSKKSKPSSSKKGGSKTTMAKSGFNTQKIFKYIRLAGLALPAAQVIMESGLTQAGVERLIQRYTGFDPRDGKFHFEYLAQGYLPYLGTILATYGIPKLSGMIRGL